ncbi:ABC transporter permease [Sporosarcina oncorhynchi]|uniref:ABC transporter permease n=1 Tax=Sporosarcina oncorhynchi TaxID=3056444 RepID=A0ABZ0L901_9BACL|nr:oligopeptide ABC transporter permease [Sporosarcina sp. T2O-4]WOV88122.1 ABC transporter permease [Sporosarcina sp. T2O-4]
MVKTTNKRQLDMFEKATMDKTQSEKIESSTNGFWSDAISRLLKNKASAIALAIIIILMLLSVFGPFMNSYGFDDQDVSRAYLPPKVPILENISWLGMDGTDINGNDQYAIKDVDTYFWFGTDSLGRDQWTRIWEGTRVSLFIALLAAAIDLVIGVVYGGISAYYGGRVDNIMQRILEILIGLPNLILILLVILLLQPGITSIVIAMTITGWTGMSRVVRGQMLKLKNEEYVLAARTLGAPHHKVIFKHLMPNSLGQIIITTMFTIPSAIFFEAFLSFIGLGIRAPQASLGSLASEGYSAVTIFPHIVIWPALIISLLLISFNILADGLRDAFDPKMRV